MFDIQTNQRVFGGAHSDRIERISFNANGNYLFTAARDGSVLVFETKSGTPIRRFRHDSIIWDMQFCDQSDCVLVAEDQGRVTGWNADLGKKLFCGHHDGRNAVRCLSVSSDGKLLASGCGDHTARIWEIPTGKELCVLRHQGSVTKVCFGPNNRLLALATPDSGEPFTVHCWELETGTEIQRRYSDTVLVGVDVRQDGRIATSSWGGSLKIWEPDLRQEYTTLRHKNRLEEVRFSPDGSKVAVACWDNCAYVWELSREHLMEELKKVAQLV